MLTTGIGLEAVFHDAPGVESELDETFEGEGVCEDDCALFAFALGHWSSRMRCELTDLLFTWQWVSRTAVTAALL